MLSSLTFTAIGLLALEAAALPVNEIIVERAVAKNKTAGKCNASMNTGFPFANLHQVDQTTYDALAHYAAFPPAANTLQSGPCAKTPYNTIITNYFNNNVTDTQAAIFRDDSAKEFILGIPGTNDFQDLITDFTTVPVPYIAPNLECVGCVAHLGFYTAWLSIADDVSKALKTNIAAYPSYKIKISGHSLGGAIAQLAFAALKPQFSGPLTQAYTYGQPRVGNAPFANFVDMLSGATDSASAPGIYMRTTHYNDGVPQLPPQYLGFRHSRTEFQEATMVAAESTTYRCYGQEPADCNDSIGDMNVATAINAAHGSYAGIQYSCTTGTSTS